MPDSSRLVAQSGLQSDDRTVLDQPVTVAGRDLAHGVVRGESGNQSSAAPLAAFRQSLAVLVGIDDYTNGIPQLTTPANDATRLAETLRRDHGYTVRLLVAPQDTTGASLTALLRDELPSLVEEDDRLLFYFAGHGIALDGDDGPQGFLVPLDARPNDPASLLAMTEIHAWLTALPCRHMLAILDCCFAGAFRWASTRDLGVLPDVVYKERFDRYLASPAWQVVTSAAYDQRALDGLSGNVLGSRGAQEASGKRHSPFALALYEALQGEGDLIPRGKGDGVITATELYLYLRETVEVQADELAGHAQTPGLWPLAKHRRGEFIFLTPGRQPDLPPAPALTGDNNPYRGLRSYDEQHTELFFGRQEEIRALTDMAERQPFVAVLGASGTGKSSLVKAGLLSHLKETEDPWSILPPFRPTDHPMRALQAVLRGSELAVDIDQATLSGDDALAQIVGRWCIANSDRRLVLAVDQFEELITLCRDEQERSHFLALLSRTVETHPDIFRLVITLRTDFEPQFLASTAAPALASLWPNARFIVPPMDIDDLRQVIEGPAAVRVLYFEPPELVDELIKEVIQTPGALPLLSFTLSELYIKYLQSGRDNRALTAEDFKALGGVIGSLRNRATEEYDRLPDDAHRQSMQRVMVRMVSLEGGELARRRVPLTELEYPGEAENARVQTVVDRLVDARLLVRGALEGTHGNQGEPYVEPAHDALILAWDKLLLWKRAADDYLPLQRRVSQAAAEWSRASSDAQPGLLWDGDPRLPQLGAVLWPAGSKQTGLAGRGQRLRQALWPKANIPVDSSWLNRVEAEFVRASIMRRAKGLRRVVAITLAVMVALAGLALVAQLQSAEAQRQRKDATTQRDNAVAAQHTAISEADARATEVIVRKTAEANAVDAAATAVAENRIARARELASSAIGQLPSDPELGRLLAIESAKLERTAEGEEALRQALLNPARAVMRGHTNFLDAVAFSPDGTHLLTGSPDLTLRRWDVASGRLIEIIDDQTDATSIQYSPDGQAFAIGTGKTVQVRAAESGRVVAEVEARVFRKHLLQFSPDGRRFAAPLPDEQDAGVWEASTGRLLATLKGHSDEIVSVAFSPEGQRLVTGNKDATVRVWDASTGTLISTLTGHTKGVVWAEFSHDGELVASASDDATMRVWRVATAESVLVYVGRTGIVDAAMSPDGQYVVAGNWDGTATLKGFLSSSIIAELRGHLTNLSRVEFSPNSMMVATASGGQNDNDVRIWEVQRGRLASSLHGNASWINGIAFSPDSRLLATAGDDQTARVWDISLGTSERFFDGDLALAGRGAWSRDDQRIVGTRDGIAQVWDVHSGTLLMSLSREGMSFTQAAYSPDGSRILTWNHDEPAATAIAYLWDSSTGQLIATLKGQAGSNAFEPFSADGRLILTSADGSAASLWNAETGELAGKLQDSSTPFAAASWSADGQRIIAQSKDERIQVWDAATGRVIFDAVSALQPYGVGVALSPDGKRAAVLDGVGVTSYGARVWDVASGAQLFRLTGHSGTLMDVEFSPDGKQIATTSNDYSARLWDAQDGHPVANLLGHINRVNAIRYSPDGRFVVTAGDDEIARLWNARTGSLLMTLYGTPGQIFAAEFSSDGQSVVASGSQGTQLYRCPVCGSFDELLQSVQGLVARELTPTEREIFLHETPTP